MQTDFDPLFARHQDRLEDFWGRRENRLNYIQEFLLFGRTVRVATNQADLLAAVELSRPQYSQANRVDGRAFQIELVVRPAPVDPGPVPDDLVRHIQYTGQGNWLAIHYGPWGHCQVDLAGRYARSVLTPELASRPYLVSSWMLNTVFTNLLVASGLGMLHATALTRGKHAFLLMGQHNSGKSTAALNLVLAGYALLSDSLVYLSPSGEQVQLFGFPVGRLKLRSDVLGDFPDLQPLLSAEPIRGETKFVLDVRQLGPRQVVDWAVTPATIDLSLLSRSGAADTRLELASRSEVMDSVLANSLYYDEPAAWARNLKPIQRLIERSRLHHLRAGTRPESLVAAVDSLWAD